MRKDEDLEEHELIKRYFNQGYSNNEIIEFMKLHGVTISLSTLKSRIKSLNLSIRGTEPVTDEEIRKAIEAELGCFIGYRKMWARLKRKGISVSRDRIMEQLRDLDPEVVNSRKKKRLRRRAYHGQRLLQSTT